MPNFSRRPFRRTPDGDDNHSPIADDDGRPLSRLRQLLSRREAKLAGILLLLVVVGFGCWLGVRAFEAKSGLEQARNSAQQAKDALLQGDTGDASKWADDAQFPCAGGTRCDSLAAMEHRRGRALARQPFQDRSTDIRRCARLGSRRTAAFGGCRRSALTRPVARRRPGRRATASQRGTRAQQDIGRCQPT